MKEGLNNMNSEDNNNMSRGSFLKKLGIITAAAVLTPKDLISETSKKPENIEANRSVESSKIKEMDRHGDLHEGFSRYKINLKFSGEKEIEGGGSFISLEDAAKGKAEFISNKLHPEFFAKGVNFDAIEKHYTNRGKKVTLVVAGAYYVKDTHNIEGVAIENGKMVGQDAPKAGSNGLLVIKNGNPEIQFVNQLPDFNAYKEEIKNAGDSMFQQTSYLRPGGKFNSTKPEKFELRFFVEGEMNGKSKKGVINFSTSMTYTEAVETMSKMDEFKISKAIGLDTGDMSEGYFYSKQEGQGDKKNLMIDEDIAKSREAQCRNEYTNVLVFCEA